MSTRYTGCTDSNSYHIHMTYTGDNFITSLKCNKRTIIASKNIYQPLEAPLSIATASLYQGSFL
uniref:Uncharacterized protein n=1 Tax=Arundo donax TaxID=35708 RepID=A0A0A9EVN5_ARUDO